MSPSAARSEASNEELARLARRRETAPERKRAREAFSQLYLRCAPRLLTFLSARTPRADLDDAHSAVWVRIWEQLPEQFDGNHFLAWAFQISTDYFIDRSRRRPESTEPVTPEGQALEQQRRRVLAGCLEKLPPESRELITGRLDGEADLELARRLGLPAERAHRLLHTARQQLQDCFMRAGL
jgi:RNA polymerase sigma factor (sigma-70 family)